MGQRFRLRQHREQRHRYLLSPLSKPVQRAPIPAVLADGMGSVAVEEHIRYRSSQSVLSNPEKLYLSILQNTDDIVLITDNAGIFTFICPNISDMLGYAPAEVQAMGHIDRLLGLPLFAPEQLRQLGAIANIERLVEDKSGDRHTLLITVKRVEIQGGTVLYSCRDITDRYHPPVERQAVARAETSQEAISPQQSEERYRQLFNSSQDAILVHGIQPDGTLTHYLEANDVACQLLGYSREELLLQTPHHTNAPEMNSNVPAIVDVLLAQKHHLFEMVIQNKARQQIPIEINAHLFDLNGQLVVVSVLRDITRRRQLETELRQSEEHFRSLSACSPVGIFLTDPGGRCTYTNPRCQVICGFTADDDLEDGYAQFIHLDDREWVMADWSAHARSGLEWFRRHRLQVDADTVRWVSVRTVPVHSQEGVLTGHIGTIEDITEQWQTEEALRQQVERERLLGAIAQQISHSLNLDEILTTTVKEVRHLLQADRVMIYRIWSETDAYVTAEANAPDIDTVIEQPRSAAMVAEEMHQLYHQSRLSINNSDADQTPAFLGKTLQRLGVKSRVVVPILLQDAPRWGFIIVHHCRQVRQWQPWEISLLQQLATKVAIAIRQSELYKQVQRLNVDLERQVQTRTAQLQLAFEFEATLKRIADRVRDSLDENQILQTAVQELVLGLGVTCCNAALYDLDQGTSTVCYEYTTSVSPSQGHVAYMSDFPELYEQLISGQYFQFCSIHPSPVRGHVAMLACPILDDRGVLGDLWLINHKYYGFSEQDIRLVQQVANQCAIAIRQARLYQTAQAQVAELERLNQLKNDFLSTVSHELRTPVANMKMAIRMLHVAYQSSGMSETVVDRPTGPADKTMRYLTILQDECEREINLINDLLDLQRLEEEAQPKIIEAIDLQQWILAMVDPFRDRAEKRQQILSTALEAQLPLLMSDPNSLERIVAELLNNACKYTPPHGRIHLAVGYVAPLIYISVTNTGVEIPSQELPRIFDKFYRVPSSDPWKQGGTGLGLALVQKLTTYLKGTIRAESKGNQTSLTLWLPPDHTALPE